MCYKSYPFYLLLTKETFLRKGVPRVLWETFYLSFKNQKPNAEMFVSQGEEVCADLIPPNFCPNAAADSENKAHKVCLEDV